ncbi:MAG: PLP-dependent transferase [Planctomycetaceae bacterium]
MAVASDEPHWDLPEPIWRAEDLGKPIPDSPHACSVAMPLWEHNVGYEEGDESVISKFSTGYPRFFMNPLVVQLREKLARDIGVEPGSCLPLPTKASAERCADYVSHRTSVNADERRPALVHSTSCGVWLTSTSDEDAYLLREYWQHAGEGISSRTAEACLGGEPQSISNSAAKQTIRQRVADLQHVSPEDVYLFPSGMAAIYAAYRLTHREELRSSQFGFPYVDTHKILDRFGSESVVFHPHGNADDMHRLVEEAKTSGLGHLFSEAPGNPLLTIPNLPKLHEISREFGFAMVIDDTLGGMINVDVRPFADIITTSLTKFFSGGGDIMAGALVTVPGTSYYERFKTTLSSEYEDLLADEDAEVLAANSVDVVQRVQKINTSAAALVEALREHPNVERVYYPDDSADRFNQIRDEQFDSGFGGLLSVLLKNPSVNAPKVYDALQISKGPNLGTNFTLCCPYTILAHYDELDFVEACGVSRYLIRISVGLEDTDWIVSTILKALA